MVKNKLMFFGLVILVFFTVTSIFASFISPYDPNKQNLEEDLLSPSINHILGTDEYGRDVLSRIFYGGRVSLSVGIIAVSISVLLGTFFGLLAGFSGRWIDALIMRFVDVMLAFPSIFLILTIQVMLKPSIINVMVIIGATSWMGVARLVRAEVLSLREREFIEAQKALGSSPLRIMFFHLLPNVLTPIIIAATLGVGGAILTESVLSYLGLGVQPPAASWGNMLTDALVYMRQAPHLAIFPGCAILLTVLSINFVGEGMKEQLLKT
jgi:peptide/nickel transport system permease protein